MPLPSPKKGEMRQEFVSRCISFVKNEGSDMSDEQVQAACFSKWRDHTKMVFAGTSMTAATVLQPIKAVEGEPNRYRGYAILFGDEENRDLYEQFFTKDTNFHLDWFDRRPWLYHHGIHPDMGSIKIGEWDTIGVDEEGVFLEGEREAHHKYQEAVDTLLAEGVLFPSSGTLSYVAKVAEDGQITDWPIVEVSSTVLPAEYRMGPFSPAASRAIKSIGGDTMSTVWETVRTAIDDALGASSDDADEDADQDTKSNDGEAGDDDSAEETPTVDIKEVSLEVARAIDLPKVVEAIKGLDSTVKEAIERLDAVEAGVETLKAQDVEKLKKAVEGGDWYGGLFVASRDADNASADDKKGAEEFHNNQTGNDKGVDIWAALQGGQGA